MNIRSMFRHFAMTSRLIFALLLITAHSAQAQSTTAPSELLTHTLSATQIRLSWKAPLDTSNVRNYRIFRDGKRIAKTRDTHYLDTDLTPGTRYHYYVVAMGEGKISSEASNTNSAKTLINDDNDGLRNGSGFSLGGVRIQDVCEGYTSRDRPDIPDIPAEELDACIDNALAHYDTRHTLDDMRAFVARLRREEDAPLVELGMRLFHSKSLSKNNDTSCASCHHPALGCGGDNLSLPVGVNAANPELLGVGRTDGNTVPSVGRNSQPICNSALWVESMFWDQRIKLREPNDNDTIGQFSSAPIRTPEGEVTDIVNTEIDNTDPLRLLIAQAHFPITAEHEMGDAQGFPSEQAYREHIASKLAPQWNEEFEAAFGSSEINFTRVARALAAYEASFLFIDNPFFDYMDGELDSLTEDEKRGALMFYAHAGCANCHDGAFFTPERTRGPLYPQIGANAVADGNGIDNQFRMPSLLNVGITAPYGDKGAFATLEEVISHYNDVTGSLVSFYAENKTCQLPQFSHFNLTDEQCREIVGGGEAFVLDLHQQQRDNDDRGDDALIRGFTQQEIGYLADFLRTLTDKRALPGSADIQALTPPRDGGPDGNQLNAIDKDGKAL